MMTAPRLLLATDLARARLPLLDLAAEAVSGGVDAKHFGLESFLESVPQAASGAEAGIESKSSYG